VHTLAHALCTIPLALNSVTRGPIEVLRQRNAPIPASSPILMGTPPSHDVGKFEGSIYVRDCEVSKTGPPHPAPSVRGPRILKNVCIAMSHYERSKGWTQCPTLPTPWRRPYSAYSPANAMAPPSGETSLQRAGISDCFCAHSTNATPQYSRVRPRPWTP